MNCTRCGHCCKTVRLFWPNDPDSISLAKIRGLKIVNTTPENYFITIEIEKDCPHLRQVDGKYECAMQKNKPKICRDFYCEKCK